MQRLNAPVNHKWRLFQDARDARGGLFARAEMVPVKVGDVIEFAPLQDAGGGPLATGKVVDVDAVAAECVVQLSPFEPLQRLRLGDAHYKVGDSSASLT